jgi:indole-3-glycerol phosphate synthase
VSLTILDQIVASKRREVDAARRRMPQEELEAQAAEAPPVRDFRAALAAPGPIRLIAEVKKASPSAGVIRPDFDPIAIARTYQAHGADCLSVLTDAPYFQGHLSYLARIRASVVLPLLRKDFLIDEYQVVEARVAGADAVLLIAEILDDAQMAGLLACARRLGMSALVEFHDPANLPRVLAAGADLVGVNNRDLKRFVTDLELTLRLRDQVPPGVVLVAESGIKAREDVRRLEAAGVDAILVGETLMRAPDIGQAVEELLGLGKEAT